MTSGKNWAFKKRNTEYDNMEKQKQTRNKANMQNENQ